MKTRNPELGSPVSRDRRRWLAGVALALAAGTGARAQAVPPPEVLQALAAPRLQGRGRLRMMGFSIYDAQLWVDREPVGAADWAAVPLVLELIYARRLVGRQIAERSMTEMARQGPIEPEQAAQWLAQLQALIPDVDARDRLSAVWAPSQALRLIGNGRTLGELQDPALGRRFLGIWLSPQTSQPDLRRNLLGRGSA